MLHKGKLTVFFGSALIALYGISAAFYGKVVATDEAYPALSVFMDALNKISEDYVEAPDMSKVREGAMRGLIEALDPYSSFLTKEQVKELEQRKQDGFVGIGAVVSKRGDIIYVVSIEEESAAASTGLRPGDYILSIDGAGVGDRSAMEVDAMLSGPAGTSVKLGLYRSGRTEPVEVEAMRRAESAFAVNTEMLDGKVGVLDVPSLRTPAAEQAKVKLKTLVSAGAEKLILDLRDCAEGRVEDGADLAAYFLQTGTIYVAKDREGKLVSQAEAGPDKFITDLPLVVLINGSTAQAAEVVAGALKDHGRAKIVGEKSFGSASLQKRITLKSGAMLILSTAKYYTPSGKMIQEDNHRSTGIKPDVEWPNSDRRQDLAVESYFDEKEDAAKYRALRSKIYKEQMDKALEILGAALAPARRVA